MYRSHEKKNQKENIIFISPPADEKLTKYLLYKNNYKTNHPMFQSKLYYFLYNIICRQII